MRKGGGENRRQKRIRIDEIMTERDAILVLNMVEHVGPVKLRALRAWFGSAAKVLEASESELKQVEGIGEAAARAIGLWEKTVDLSGELRKIEEFGVHVIVQGDADYPANLAEIHDPPMLLYVKGELKPADKHAIAIVGSRHTTHYGAETAKKLGYQLAYAGVTVVSGLARGIDTAAHQGALAARGRTIAVLGCGINVVYPPENKALYDKIVESGGAVVTEYPFNSPPEAHNFAIRNRVISGLSLGVLVVEAPVSSGALITVKWAEEQGRPVFAVPGRIDSPTAKGCHRLIKDGAKLVEDAEDILSEFEYLRPLAEEAKTREAGEERPAGTVTRPANLSETEQKVLAVVGAEEMEIDEIIRASDLTSGHVSATLLALEMKKLVKQLPGKRFVRVG